MVRLYTKIVYYTCETHRIPTIMMYSVLGVIKEGIQRGSCDTEEPKGYRKFLRFV